MAFCPCTTQVRLAKDRKKGDKIVSDSQERAYWRAYRPPPGCLNCLEHPPYRHPNATSTSSRRKWNSINDIKTEVLYCNHPPTHFRMSPDEESMALKTARLRSILFFPLFQFHFGTDTKIRCHVQSSWQHITGRVVRPSVFSFCA